MPAAELVSARADHGLGGSGHRITLHEVARAAGVSLATASKVVNGRGGVGELTRERVEEVVTRLGYVSIAERHLGRLAAREETIELVVDPRHVANPYLSTLLGGAMQYAGHRNIGLLLRSIDVVRDADPVTWAQELGRAGRAGVIEVTSEYSARRDRALQSVGVPMVLVDPIDVPRASVASIGAANWSGAFEATRHLLELGHRRIAYIGGPDGAGCDVFRAHGWASAMAGVGLQVDPNLVPRGSYTFEHGLQAALTLLRQPDAPTAIFAGSDLSAMGVLEAARQTGVSVPGELSVVGFDDTLLAQTSTPRLTAVHQPIASIGAHAVATVLRLAQGDTLSTKRIELATELVIRDSTAPVRVAATRKGGRP